MGAISWELLRRLASVRPRLGPAVSLYLDLDPRTTPTWSDVETRAGALLASVAAERDRVQHEERASLDEDIERIHRYLRRELDRDGIRGLALFAAANAGLWEEVRLPEAPDSGVRVDRELHLAPLVPFAALGESALVAVVNRRRGSLYRLVDGSVEELADLSDENVPTRHDQGGWSQANFQRHVDALAHRHVAAVAQELDRRFRQEGRPPVVLVCPEEERSEVEGELPGELAAAVVGWTSVEAHASAAAVARAVRPLLDRRRAARIDDTAARWRDERAAGRGACGWVEVLPAASDGRVEELLYDARTADTAFRCSSCGRGLTADGPCPVDGAHVEPVDAVNLAVLRSLAHGGTVQALDDAELLDGEPACALLRW